MNDFEARENADLSNLTFPILVVLTGILGDSAQLRLETLLICFAD